MRAKKGKLARRRPPVNGLGQIRVSQKQAFPDRPLSFFAQGYSMYLAVPRCETTTT
jgi:hypothetical protein